MARELQSTADTCNDCGADFDAIYRRWYPALVRQANRMLRDHALAEEVAQEVMLAYWLRGAAVESDADPRAYLQQATRNRSLNALRRARLEARAAPLVHYDDRIAPSILNELLGAELAEVAQRVIRELPRRCRESFLLTRASGLSHVEAAQRLGVTVKAVEASVGRALRALRESLRPHLHEDAWTNVTSSHHVAFASTSSAAADATAGKTSHVGSTASRVYS
ncbi:MAG: sigma-70 family RNA polymerase sigma factor [Gemmatimonadota bacterium]